MDIKTPTTALIKALASLNPITAAIVTAADEYLKAADDRKLQHYTALVEERFEALEGRLDPEACKTEAFAELFTLQLFIVEHTQRIDKLRAAANIMANAILKDGDPDKLPYGELEHFSRCLDRLSAGALHILAKVNDYALLKNRGLGSTKIAEENLRVDFGDVAGQMPDVDRDFLMAMLEELANCHLLVRISGHHMDFTDRNRKYENEPFQTTPLGHRFVKYVLEPGRGLPDQAK